VGVLASLPAPGPGGYAAIWRDVSGLLAEPASQAGFRDPGYWLRVAAQNPLPARESSPNEGRAEEQASAGQIA
jgi:hypothetical protein